MTKEKKTKRKKKGKGNRTQNPMSRRWCFTLYPEKLIDESNATEYLNDKGEVDPKKIDLERLDFLLRYAIEPLRGICMSVEEGDSKEHIHIQGYIELKTPERFGYLQKRIGHGVHLETANGDRQANFDYILHKGEHQDKGTLHSTYVWGEWPSCSGNEKNMYDECVAMVLEGYSIATICKIYKGSVLQNINQLARLQAEVEKDIQVDLTYLRNKEIRRQEWIDANEIMEEIPY